MTEADDKQGAPLLGLRLSSELAEGTVDSRLQAAPAVPRTAPQFATPSRPNYPVISSGWDSEVEETRGKSSDMAAALRAGLVLLVLIIALAWLLR